jgi:hypothetical protein
MVRRLVFGLDGIGIVLRFLVGVIHFSLFQTVQNAYPSIQCINRAFARKVKWPDNKYDH